LLITAFKRFLCYIVSGMSSRILLKKLCSFILLFSFSAFCNSFDPYEVLGVSPSASEAEIKKAFRESVKQWHPDRNRNLNEEERLRAEEKFKEINKAYEVLKGPRRRATFTQYGVAAESSQNRTLWNIFNEKEDRRSSDGFKLKPYEIRAVKLFLEFSFFNKESTEFLVTEARYLSLLKEQQSGQTLSQDQKRELNDYRVENLKDLELFKRILSQLGLPHSSLPPHLLQPLLDDLRREWHSRIESHFQMPLNRRLEDLREPRSRSSLAPSLVQRERVTLPTESRDIIIGEKIIRVLREIKTGFDNMQYESLRTGSQIFRKPFLKSFGTQFIVFHTALGFSIYMQALYDKKITGYEKNPGELMESAKHSLTPSGLLSFFIFVAVASKVQYRLYGLGRFLDGKTVLGKSWNGGLARSLGPPLGLGSGFFFYRLFDGLWQDLNLRGCVKSQFKSDSKESGQSLYQDHITDCEQFYLNWQAGEKWKMYGVDIVSIIGSSLISHKITSSIAKHAGRTMIGHSAMSWIIKKLGPRGTGYGGFFINMLMFLEVHKYLDRWAGKPVKEQILAGGVNSNVSNLEEALQNIDLIPDEFWMQVPNKPAGAEGRLSYAPFISNPVDELSRPPLFPEFWGQNLNGPVGAESQMSHASFFKSANDLIKSLGNRFRIWMEFVNQDYITSYSYWTQKLNKTFINYESSLQVLEILEEFDYETEKKKSFQESYDILIKDQVHYQNNYCHLTHKEEMRFWVAFCDNDENSFYFYAIESPEAVLYDSNRLILHFLEKIEFPDYGLQAEDYISLKKEEIFSSNPEFSIQNLRNEYEALDYDKIVSLAKQMIRKGLEFETVLDNLSWNELSRLKEQKGREYFFNYQKEYDYFMKPSLYVNEIKSHCESLDFNTEELEYCLQFFETSGKKEIQYDLSLKFLRAGVYLLQNYVEESYSIYLAPRLPHNQSIVSNFLQTKKIEDLIGLIEVYKKGERAFVKSEELRRQNQGFFSKVIDQTPGLNQFSGRDGDPYFLFYDLLCNDPNKIRPSPDSFSVPQLLKDFEGIELYNFKTKQYEPLCGGKAPYESVEAREFLFSRPAKYRGELYENLYLSAESIISDRFTSRDDIMGFYYNMPQVQEQLGVLREARFQEIQALMDKLYKKAINPAGPVACDPNASCGEINQSLSVPVVYDPKRHGIDKPIDKNLLNYYDDNKVYFNSCTLIKDLSFGLSRDVLEDCEEGFRNIEVSIFQINYLLKNLKILLTKGEKLICDEESGCKSLNQRFLWLKEGGLQTFDEEGFDKIRSWVVAGLQDIHNCYKEDEDCRQGLERSVIEYSILGQAGLLHKFGNKDLDNDNQERTDYSYWEKLVHSLWIEITKGLNNFESQIMPLTLKSHFEQRLQNPNLNFGQ